MKSWAKRRGPERSSRRTRQTERSRAVRPIPPLAAAALAVGAGIALGLYHGQLLPLTIFAVPCYLAFHALSSTGEPASGDGTSRLPGAVPLLALLFACGSLLGARSAALLDTSCETSLLSGTPVRVRGTISEDHLPDASTASSGRSVRIGIDGATAITDSGACALPRLTAYVRRPAGRLLAGDPALLEGSWLRLGPQSVGSSSIRLPGTVGILVEGRIVGPGQGDRIETGNASGRRDRSLRRRIRAAVAARLRRSLPDELDPTARALLLAEKDDLSPDLRRRFADAGLAHLLAISGLHVGIIAGLVLALLTPLAVGRQRYALAAGIVAGYVLVIGAPIPALRSALLFLGWAAARARGVPLRGADLLGAAALLFLVRDPVSLVSPGFQLSFAGFTGVSLGASLSRDWPIGSVAHARQGRGVRHAVAKAGRGAALALAAGVGAFLATAPVAAWHFGRVAPASIVSSLVGTPIVALSIWSLIGALLPDPFGGSFAAAAAVFLGLLHALADWFGARAGSHFSAAPPTLEVWVAWAIAFAALGRVARGARLTSAAVPLALAVLLFQARPLTSLRASSARGLLCSLSVGQGDAAILRTLGGRWMVFDGGPATRPGPGREEIREALRRRGARSVALVTVSHPDLDHVAGLEALLAELPIGAVLDTGDPLPRDVYVRLLNVAEEKGITWLRARAGVRIRVDEAEVLVLGPDSVQRVHRDGSGPSANETSLVFRVDAGGFRYLNSGDATVEEERRVLSAWSAESLRADLLKVGHHGSRTSTSGEWLTAVQPRVAVISAGPANRFGHPHPSVLRRIEQARVPMVWRTDRNGSLCIEYRRGGDWRIAGESAWNVASTANRAPRHED